MNRFMNRRIWTSRSLTRIGLIVSLMLLVDTRQAVAHAGGVVTPGDIWTHWNTDPLLLAVLIGIATLYILGMRRLRFQRNGYNVIAGARVFAFGAALFSLVLALVTPLDPLGETLFSAHMAQHLLLIAVAAPLLVIARPGVVMLWALPDQWRVRTGRLFHSRGIFRRTWKLLTGLLIASVIQALVIWFWHIPALYDLAVGSWFIHTAEHVTFLVSGVIFWWAIIPAGERLRMNYGAGVFSLFLTAIHTGLLAALMTFSTSLWYASHDTGPSIWGLTPLQDQQLAGLIMWVPMGAIYVGTAAVTMAVWLRRMEQDDNERTPDWAATKPGNPPDGAETLI